MAIDTDVHTKLRGIVTWDGARRSIVTDKATYTLRSGPAKLSHIIVFDVGTSWTLDFYDETSGSGSLVWSWVSADGKGRHDLQIPCPTGLTVVSGGTTAGKVTIVWD